MDLPDYYFRVREHGAFVFRVDTANRDRRMEMEHIATVNLRKDEIKPHGTQTLSEADISAIRDWMLERADLLEFREMDDIQRAMDYLNTTAHWVQSRASDEQLDIVTDELLLAMHDLRTVLVRKKADRKLAG